MIRCDKCNVKIIEKTPDELDDKPSKAEESEGMSKKRYIKGTATKDEPSARRSSLVLLPYKYAVNDYERKDFDLCEECKRFLDKALDKIRFEFITTPVNERGEIT